MPAARQPFVEHVEMSGHIIDSLLLPKVLDAILSRGELADYHLAHAARADLCRRLGRVADARESYERALELARQEPERRFLMRRLGELN